MFYLLLVACLRPRRQLAKLCPQNAFFLKLILIRMECTRAKHVENSKEVEEGEMEEKQRGRNMRKRESSREGEEKSAERNRAHKNEKGRKIEWEIGKEIETLETMGK